jgi:hypothetical protein
MFDHIIKYKHDPKYYLNIDNWQDHIDYWISDDKIIFSCYYNEPLPFVFEDSYTYTSVVFCGLPMLKSMLGYENNEGWYCPQKSNFNQEINNLPKEIKELVLSYNYDKNLDNLPNLTHLTIFGKFNNPINNLPLTLLFLRFADSQFNNSIDSLPSGLKMLVLDCRCRFNQSFDNLPSSLEFLDIDGYDDTMQINNLPQGLKTLYLHGFEHYDYSNIQFPDSIEYLRLPNDYNSNLTGLKKLKVVWFDNKIYRNYDVIDYNDELCRNYSCFFKKKLNF